MQKKLFDPLVEGCTENIDVVKIDNENENKHSFRIVYIVCIVLFSIIFTISIGISICFIYNHWYLKKYSRHDDFNTHKETTIY